MAESSSWFTSTGSDPETLKQVQTQLAHGREVGQEDRLSIVTPGRAGLTRDSGHLPRAMVSLVQMRIKKLGSLLAHEGVWLLGSYLLDMVTFPERKATGQATESSELPSCPMVLRQLKANSGVRQASHSPCLNTRLSAAHLSLAILNCHPQATLGAKSHSGQWAGSPCGQ